MRKLLVLLALTLALPAANATAARQGTTLSLVAYSIPTAVFPKLISAFRLAI